jgi:3-dehydroquinate dehydratase
MTTPQFLLIFKPDREGTKEKEQLEEVECAMDGEDEEKERTIAPSQTQTEKELTDTACKSQSLCKIFIVVVAAASV